MFTLKFCRDDEQGQIHSYYSVDAFTVDLMKGRTDVRFKTYPGLREHLVSESDGLRLCILSTDSKDYDILFVENYDGKTIETYRAP